MECCNSISDYRYNSVNNTNTSYHYPYGYHPSNTMRYQHAASYRNNITPNGGGMTYDRYNSSSYNYNNTPYGYNSNSTNQYYSNPYGYSSHDSYKYLNSTNHLQQSYHHRELYGDNEQGMYRSRHNYMMRDQSYHHYTDFQLNNNSSASSLASPSPSSLRSEYLPASHPLSNGTSIDSTNHHHYNQHHYYPYHHNPHHYQYHHSGYSSAPYNDYVQHPPSASSYYNNGYLSNNDTSSTGYTYSPTKDGKSRKIHRDRNLSKLVAMNRRLESQVLMMNESERMGIPYSESYQYLENSDTPRSMLNASYNESHSNYSTEQVTDVLRTVVKGELPSQESEVKIEDAADSTNNNNINSNNVINNSMNNNSMNNNNSADAEKYIKDVIKMQSEIGEKETKVIRRRRPKEKKIDLIDNKDDSKMRNVIPLPGFQQAFGSTEIGRFSELFFNSPESPFEPCFESEPDTLSPQPWETGDSLEGPHYKLENELMPAYADSYGSTDSPSTSSSSYFSDIRPSDF